MSNYAPVEQDIHEANEAAQRALAAIRSAYPQVGEDVSPDCLSDHATKAVSDLLADLMHLLRRADEDVDAVIEQARRDYDAEVNGTVVALIENGYECGHTSSKRVVLLAPEPGEDLDTWWTETVFGLTSDPHDCDSDRENATRAVRIVDAPDHPELLNETYG